mgnify:FL=1
MTTGELTSLIAYTMQILMNLMMLSMVFVMITMARASSERIVEILDEKSDLTNPENPVYEIKNGDISFRNVNFGYSKKKRKLCLKNINLDIKSGETVGIIGGTGSSKSSLVQLIPRLYDTTDGEVIVGDRNVKEYDIESLRDELQWYFRKMCCSPEQSKKTCVGVMTTQQMKKSKEYVSLHKPMNLFRHSLISMILISNRAVQMYRAVRNKDFVSQELC